ncbi:MAG TPA: hypothetical protein PLL57_15535 [Flavobacteriales bacterium]|nr:hypothetical protein [Flavobacteriales bacterium]
MNTKNWTRHLAWGVLGLVSQQAYSQATQDNNNGGANSFLGWNAGANQVLEVKNEANQRIEWYTDSLRRMLLSPTQTGQTLNGYGGLDLSGNLGIGQFSTALVTRPFTRLHLDNGGSQDSGFRPWMVTGMSLTRGSDMAYVGMKDEGSDRNHTVITWSDNTSGDGPDQLRFLFTSDNGFWGAGLSGGIDGLEAARLLPAVSGDEVFFGIGDWTNTGSTAPAERLDVRDRPLLAQVFGRRSSA